MHEQRLLAARPKTACTGNTPRLGLPIEIYSPGPFVRSHAPKEARSIQKYLGTPQLTTLEPLLLASRLAYTLALVEG